MRVLRWLPLVLAAGLAAWICLYPTDWQGWLGFTRAAYFTTGQNYAFYSGVGPMMLTGLGLSTIIGGLWHHVNCHYDGCARIGKHKVSGTPWCSRHHEQARVQVPLEDKLDTLIELLTAQAQARKPAARK